MFVYNILLLCVVLLLTVAHFIYNNILPYMAIHWREGEAIKPGMERNGMEPIGARVDFKLLAFHFKPQFTQKFCSCSYTTAV